MIGFVADPERVDYWTSYQCHGSLEEFRKTKHWARLSDKKKALMERGAENARLLRERETLLRTEALDNIRRRSEKD